jgi:hypothetical protein
MSKKQRDENYSVEHSIQRLQERYNITITEKEFHNISTQVKEFLETHTKKNEENEFAQLYDVSKQKDCMSYVVKIKNFNNIIVWCTFESGRNCITTFLPPITKKK